MRQIPLTRGKVTVVDDCDYDWLMQWNWCCSSNGYAVRGYERHKKIYLHREILKRSGVVECVQGDHRNRDTLDNRRSNLRAATREQNQHNQGISRNNASGFKGVSFATRSGQWQAAICVNGVARHLGYFARPIEAAKAYNNAAEKLHGDFAYLNEV